MRRNVIYITGVACPSTPQKIRQETFYAKACIQALKQKGCEVAVVGKPWQGFYMRHVAKAFTALPDVDLVIVNAHGNIDDKKHYLSPRENEDTFIISDIFYKKLAQMSGNRPLNIFMFSCGSGNGVFDAAKDLPVGSSVVNVAAEDDVLSFDPAEEMFDIPDRCDIPLAENLFLNMLSKGYAESINRYYPQITVSVEKRYEGNIWALWDLARQNTLDQDYVFSADFEDRACRYLADYFSAAHLSKAMRTIELYTRACYGASASKKGRGTPVDVRYYVDEKFFEGKARTHQLYGAMCALGYFADRDAIQAFRADASRPEQAQSEAASPALIPA